MAKHYYQIDLVTSVALDEEELEELERTILSYPGVTRAFAEYVDSEGK